VKLLRVLQEREFERVGGTETVKVDVRVVSATHRDLERQINDGKFREDLYYRLNVFPIVLPPLRERAGDIALLAEHFVQKFARAFGKQVNGLDPSAVSALSGYAWPGNVRELENVIERALILSRGPDITAADLEFTKRAGVPAPSPGTPPAGTAAERGRPLQERLSEQERVEIIAAIDQSQGNIAHAARRLGINRSTLYYRLRKHALEHLLPLKEPAASPDATASAAPAGSGGTSS
jgi:DNA-binding NtrC family response regulator